MCFFFSSRRRHTRYWRDWSSDVCSSDLKDIKVYRIDAMDAANEMNNAKAFNMIVLGGLLKLHPVVTLESAIKGLKKTLPERHHHLIPMNEEAIKRGMELIREVG